LDSGFGRFEASQNNPATVDRTLLFLPGQAHLGVEAADPMLVMRNIAYPISLGQRQ
jgi:catalase